MLNAPKMIKEHNYKIEEFYEKENYVKIYLPREIKEEEIKWRIENYIIKEIIKKYPEKEKKIKELIFYEKIDYEKIDYERPLVGNDFFKELQEEVFKSLDIFFMEYERLNEKIRKNINTLVRIGCSVGTGKLLFHIVSEYRYLELRSQGFKFDTYCNEEKILLGHEIEQLDIYEDKVIDDYVMKREKIRIMDTEIIYQKEFWKKKIETEKYFEEYRGKDNYIKNKKDDSHEAIWFGPVGYKYGNYKELKKEEMPKEIKRLAREIEVRMKYEKGYFNSVYINRYNKAGIGYHHDNDRIFRKSNKWEDGKEIIVAVYSIGEECVISINNRLQELETLKLKVEDNSLYIMEENFQNTLYHKVGNAKRLRYSYTFRHCTGE